MKTIKRIIPLLIITYICWPIALIYIITGIYDIIRHKHKYKFFIFKKYFFGNGTLTWILSPLNMIIDILCLPFVNKQIYKLEDLPKKHQEEIKLIINQCPQTTFINYLNNLESSNKRTLMLYKWYGYNIDNALDCNLFHQKFKTIQPIGNSTIRVLINIDQNIDQNAYIDVNNVRHNWKIHGPLFIFDDTIMHQSFNMTDKNRHCLFIDITRPSYLSPIINYIIKFLGFVSINVPFFIKSSRWKVTT